MWGWKGGQRQRRCQSNWDSFRCSAGRTGGGYWGGVLRDKRPAGTHGGGEGLRDIVRGKRFPIGFDNGLKRRAQGFRAFTAGREGSLVTRGYPFGGIGREQVLKEGETPSKHFQPASEDLNLQQGRRVTFRIPVGGHGREVFHPPRPQAPPKF